MFLQTVLQVAIKGTWTESVQNPSFLQKYAVHGDVKIYW